MHVSSRTLFACPAVAAAVLLATACSSGSGGSDVGSGTNMQPIARALVVNSGATSTVREGAEVLLTARDSEDPDGPLLDWTWTAPEGIDLIERTRTTASFTAPDVDAPTTYTFELTVHDSHNLTDSTSIDVTVVPAGDPDRFLAPRAVQNAPSDAFTLTAALRPGAGAGGLDAPFTIDVAASVTYISRSGSAETVELDLEELGAPIEGTWPAGETVTCASGMDETECMLESYVNSDFRFRIPRLDITEINQRWLDAGEPNRQLDQHMTSFASIEIRAVFDAGTLQDQAVLLVSAGGGLVAQSDPSVIGIPAQVTVSAEALLAAMPGEESATTADIYYYTVDPYFRRTTLNQWLFNAGFASDTEGTLLPEAVNGEGEFAHVLYTNNYDLGFGRDMYTRVEPDGDVYAFVVNYPTLEAGLKRTDELVTVVMEFTPPDDPSLHASCLAKGRFVKFFTFAPDDRGDSQRIGSMNFDGRGERHTPGNCVTCHGGETANLDEIETGAWGQPVYRNCGDTNATFMPWDLDSFLYSDDDPAIANGAPRPDGTPLVEYLDPQGRWTRAAQEEQFRKVNAAALSTYLTYIAEGGDPERVAAAVDLVHGWYADQPDVPGTRFDGSYTPAGWNVSPEVAEVYHDSYARFCRACHSLRADPSKQFRSYDAFVVDPINGPRELEDIIYRRGIMPLARLTMDRFWVPFEGGSSSVPGSAAERLAALLAEDARLSFDPSARPGSPVFEIARTPDPAKEGDIVRLDAGESAFVDDPQWTALPATANGVCVEPTLIAANTLEVAFRATTPGRYCIQLAAGGDSTVVEVDVAANAAPQLDASRPQQSIAENSAPIQINLRYTDSDDPPGDLIFTVHDVVSGELTLEGDVLTAGAEFTQQDIDSGKVRFEPDLGGIDLIPADPSVVGGFSYSLTDGVTTLGAPGSAALEYRVSIFGVDLQPSFVLVDPVGSEDLVFGGTVNIGWDNIKVDDPDTADSMVVVHVALGADAAGTLVGPTSLTKAQLEAQPGAFFTYKHNGDASDVDLLDELLVTVSDETDTIGPVPLSVAARVTFDGSIANIIDNPAEPNDDTLASDDDCASCHRPGSPYPSAFVAAPFVPGDVDYAAVRSKVIINADGDCEDSLLLRKPRGLDGHTGGLRPGFDVNNLVDGNRDNYNLFHAWICESDAVEN